MVDKEKLLDVVVCKGEDTVLEVSKVLRDTQVRHLIVTDDEKKPLGIISTVDINNRVVAEGKDVRETKASEIMTSPIKFVDVNDSNEKACEIMIEQGTYSIPVTEEGRLVGLLDFNQVFCKISKEK